MDGTVRSEIKPGTKVAVVQKHHQKTGELTEGIVKNLLTGAPVHHRGIKVRLTDGTIGRVKQIL
ncbi:MAG: YwbE family protein [Spirochaetes bacterium]|nr:YwbE family protein [Spirochaetota bacterium]